MTLRNKNGFTIVESLLAIFVFSVSGLVFSSFVNISSKVQNRNKAKLSVSQAKTQVLTMISNKGIWYQNIKDAGKKVHPKFKDKKLNPELACLRTGSFCTDNASGYDLTLTDQLGNIVIDAIDTTKGFTADGAVCTGYSDTKPNPACPWRVALKWSPMCPAAAVCVHPQVSIQISIIASQGFMQESNLTATQVSAMVEQTKLLAPTPKKAVFITNSTHYGYTSKISIDPTAFVVTESPGDLIFTLPKNVSVLGGTVTMSGNKIEYSPDYSPTITPTPTKKIYGTDWFYYKVKDAYTGVENIGIVYVQVMTPYTWTGLVGMSDSSITNMKNFCGKVVNGACDYKTFPGASLKYNTNDSNLVFNENCQSCNVTIDSKISVRSIETSPNFIGTITQKADVAIGLLSWPGSTWQQPAAFSLNAGTWDGQAGDFAIRTPGEAQWFWPEKGGFNIFGGTFKAPPQVAVKGDVYIPNAASFKNQGGTFNWFGSYGQGNRYLGAKVEFWNLVIGGKKMTDTQNKSNFAGVDFEYWGDFDWHNLDNDVIVRNDLTIANTDGESDIHTHNNSKISLYGDMLIPTLNSGGCFGQEPATVEFVSYVDQKIIGQGLTETERQSPYRMSCVPNLVVNKPSGAFTVMDTVALEGNILLKKADSWTIKNVNLIARGGSNMEIEMAGYPVDGFYFMTRNDDGHVLLHSDLTVKNMFYWDTPFPYGAPGMWDYASPGHKKFNIEGDAILDTAASTDLSYYNQTTDLVFTGTKNQTLTSKMGMTRYISNSIIVNKTGGTMTIAGELGENNGFRIEAGNVVFDPGFGIHNRMAGADGSRTKIFLHDPANQVIPKIHTKKVMVLLSDVYAKDVQLDVDQGWWGSFYSYLGGGASSLKVSGNLTLDDEGTGGPMGVWLGGKQKVIMNGTGPQTITLQGSNSAGTKKEIDLQIQNPANPVTIVGKGQLQNITINAGSTVNLDPSSVLELNGVLNGVLNKNGTSPTGTMNVVGPGVAVN